MNPNSGAKEELIGTQGPLDPLTLTNFWRMIFMKKCSMIVMLCNIVEEGSKKCGQYYPVNKNDAMEIDHFRLKCIDLEQSNGFYITRHLEVTNTITNETRQITQLHAINWPDYGVPGPEHYADLGHLIEEMIAHHDSKKTPITVHCR
jgi:protein tyrosine phosphatase